MRAEAPIKAVRTAAYKIPTDAPESDGTLQWDSTTMVTVEIEAGGKTGFGYTYAHDAAGRIIDGKLAEVLKDRDALAIRDCWHAMISACRNFGRPGIVACAVSACDIALHDLAGKLLDVPAFILLGPRRKSVMAYGSGGFTSYDDDRLREQLGGWASQGFCAVKMKVGREPDKDMHRVQVARDAIGPDVQLMVDGNGAYDRKQALAFAEAFRGEGVTWFEEPVSSDDLVGLRLMRDRAPAGLEISAGEYGFDDFHFRHTIEAQAVDVLQADVTRCLGYTGYMIADSLVHSANLPLSSHCAPALTLPVALAALQQRHMEWFHDHVRIEALILDGAPEPSQDGTLAADPGRPGVGLSLKIQDAEQYRI